MSAPVTGTGYGKDHLKCAAIRDKAVAMLEQHEAGSTMAQVGARYGLSVSRAAQVVNAGRLVRAQRQGSQELVANSDATTRLKNCMRYADVATWAGAVGLTRAEVLRLPNAGVRVWEELCKELVARGLRAA